MHIQIVAVGKIKEPYLTQGIAEYVKRLGPYARVTLTEVPDEKAPETLSAAEARQVVDREGERILAQLKDDVHVIALAIDGALWTSEELARRLDELAVRGSSRVAFVIGGSLGLSAAVLKRADQRLSFGRLTYPHQFMRLLLVEQIYRAMRINRGEPYHK
jgi:23S rRNA (pseudouridine1915-N3)-methyltransferase